MPKRRKYRFIIRFPKELTSDNSRDLFTQLQKFGRQVLCSLLRAWTSKAEHRTFLLHHWTSELNAWTSELDAWSSELQSWTFEVGRGTCQVRRGTSEVPLPTSELRLLSSKSNWFGKKVNWLSSEDNFFGKMVNSLTSEPNWFIKKVNWFTSELTRIGYKVRRWVFGAGNGSNCKFKKSAVKFLLNDFQIIRILTCIPNRMDDDRVSG